MIHIDSKITIWDRFSLDDEHKEALQEFLQENPDTLASDISDWASELGIDGEHETLTDTGDEMTPDENGGEATVEISMGDATLWTNATKKNSTED